MENRFDQAIELLEFLFQDVTEGTINFRFKKKDGAAFNKFLPVTAPREEIKALLEKYSNYNCWYGVNPRNGCKGTKDAVCCIVAAHLDHDCVTKEIRDAIDLVLPPSAVIQTSSADRLHLLWKFKEPLGAEEKDRVENINKRLIACFDGDTGTHDVSRVLRVPGTRNYKYDTNPQVKLSRLVDSRMYELSDLEDILPEIETPEGEALHIEVNTSPELWPKAQRLISSNARIMAHWLKPKPGDRSGHDWRLACLCREAGIKDPGLLYAIIMNNPYGKATSYAGGADKYTKELISKCLAQAEVTDKNIFPHESIQGLARKFADLYAQYLESPWSFFAFAFLTCLGNVLANRVTLKSEIRPQPRLYVVLLGESADERKSESLKQTTGFFTEAIPDKFFPTHGVGSAEGLAERLEKHAKTVLVYDEFKSFVSKTLIESSVLLPCVNTLFDSMQYHSHTKGHSIEVDRGYLSILAASTVDTYSKMWTSAFTDIGFINRLWLVPDKGEKKFAIPQMIDEDAKNALRKELISRVKGISATLTSLEVTPEADELFSGWYHSSPRTIFTKRLDTYGLRLMLLFCANEGSKIVTVDIAERVIKLLEWQLHVREEYDVIDAVGTIARVEEALRKILRRNPDGIGKRDLQISSHYRRVGIFAWNSALSNLLKEEAEYDPKRKVYRLKDPSLL